MRFNAIIFNTINVLQEQATPHSTATTAMHKH